MSNKLKKTKTLHGAIERAKFNFEIPGETLIAVHNALAFTMAHADLYSEETPVCTHCLKAMGTMQKNIAGILQYADEYVDLSKKKLN